MQMPLYGLSRQYENLQEELNDMTHSIMKTGQCIDGIRTASFEQIVARRCKRKYAISVNSATQALIFAQMALGIKNGTILIPGYTYVANLNSVLMADNTPVFADVDHNGLLDINSVQYNMSDRDVRAIVAVNLFGNMADYDKIKVVSQFCNPSKIIHIIEDAAQSFGATYNKKPAGSFGEISVLSFDPTKNLPNYGSGGMLLMDDEGLANVCYDLRNNGMMDKNRRAGTNSRMSEIDCGHLIVKLKYFDAWQKRREEIADFYTEHLSPYVVPILPTKNVKSSWGRYVIQVSGTGGSSGYEMRNYLRTHLLKAGIPSKIPYEYPLFNAPCSPGISDKPNNTFKNSFRLCSETLCLPIYPELTDVEVETIATEIVEYFGG